jgi:hypothetical protein
MVSSDCIGDGSKRNRAAARMQIERGMRIRTAVEKIVESLREIGAGKMVFPLANLS